MECTHEYRFQRTGGLDFCMMCKKFIPPKVEEECQNFVMPPRIFEITEKLWKQIRPWKLIPYELIKKYGWYISMINGAEYLIMPILKMGNPIYFSARLLSQGTYSKYLYPNGVKKSYWVSSEENSWEPIIIITEGVADAVYCSPLGTSIALLGSYYNNSLDSLLAGHHIAICMDCDAPGILAAMRIMGQLKDVASKKIVMLPNLCDPTDLELDKLKQMIHN